MFPASWSRRIVRSHSRRGRQRIRDRHRHLGIQQIATARRRLDETMFLVVEDLAQLAHALNKRVVAHFHIGPDSLEQFLLPNEPTGILCQAAKHTECLRTRKNLFFVETQCGARQIKRKAIEL